jgi:hypothetical protein
MEQPSNLKVLSSVLALLEPLDSELRRRVLDTVLTFFSEDSKRSSSGNTWDAIEATKIPQNTTPVPFSTKTDTSPKEFLLQKAPKSDVERVACLGFYLTHFRGTAHFKTADLTALNTEAAQPRFSNAAQAVANATQYGYLAPATKGNKQISAQGERFVVALPDREAAKTAMSNRPKRSRGRGKIVQPKKQNTILAELKGKGIRVR